MNSTPNLHSMNINHLTLKRSQDPAKIRASSIRFGAVAHEAEDWDPVRAALSRQRAAAAARSFTAQMWPAPSPDIDLVPGHSLLRHFAAEFSERFENSFQPAV